MRELKIMWQLLWSIPMAVAWVVMFLLLLVGWGPKQSDSFIKHWNSMVEDEQKPFELG